MKDNLLPKNLKDIIKYFTKLPGIGEKTAERLTFFLLKKEKDFLINFGEGISNLKNILFICPECGYITENENKVCNICKDEQRDQSIICIVEEINDVIAIENTNIFNGLYHILGGKLSPMEGITPDKLNIENLKKRIDKNQIQEIIISTNFDLEGDATAMYLNNLFKNKKIKISRIAKGLPTGSFLEYMDQSTLKEALEKRRDL